MPRYDRIGKTILTKDVFILIENIFCKNIYFYNYNIKVAKNILLQY